MPDDDAPDGAESCAICLDSMGRRGRKTKALSRCGHRFHATCINAWFAKSLTCPCCRAGCHEAIARKGNVSLACVFQKVISRTPFHPEMTDNQKIKCVLDVPTVMKAWNVSEEDRAFMYALADMAFDVPHFLDMLRRIRRDCAGRPHSF